MGHLYTQSSSREFALPQWVIPQFCGSSHTDVKITVFAPSVHVPSTSHLANLWVTSFSLLGVALKKWCDFFHCLFVYRVQWCIIQPVTSILAVANVSSWDMLGYNFCSMFCWFFFYASEHFIFYFRVFCYFLLPGFSLWFPTFVVIARFTVKPSSSIIWEFGDQLTSWATSIPLSASCEA